MADGANGAEQATVERARRARRVRRRRRSATRRRAVSPRARSHAAPSRCAQARVSTRAYNPACTSMHNGPWALYRPHARPGLVCWHTCVCDPRPSAPRPTRARSRPVAVSGVASWRVCALARCARVRCADSGDTVCGGCVARWYAITSHSGVGKLRIFDELTLGLTNGWNARRRGPFSGESPSR